MNPFFMISPIDGSEYLTPKCSLNRAVMKKLPLYGIEDGIEGLAFSKIFSTPVLVEQMKHRAKYFGVDLSEYSDAHKPRFLNRALESESIRERAMADRLAVQFGNRLGLILLALRRGETENRLARDDWDDACWQYWHDLSTVVFTGGLSSGMLGRRFKEQIQYIFDRAGERPYHIMLFDNGAYLGVMGAAQRLMRDDTAAVVFDLGQTNFKRAVVRKSGGVITGFSPMDTLSSMYMESDFESREARRARAMELHRYLVKNIVSSCREAALVHELSDQIIISIASYTHAGVLNDQRGSYAKLCELGENYAQLLSEEIAAELRRPVNVRLVHDGTATALYFSDIEKSVCITLGTGFGVGFPDIDIH